MNGELEQIKTQADKFLIGKQKEFTLALACFLSRGHLLIEDRPGVGKTTMALLLSKLLGLNFSRIQFTSDMLPADILGGNLFDKTEGKLVFEKGPIFGEIILADELNRANPKTQSSLLQVMEEREISFDGNNYVLPELFTVLATQNPIEQVGTFSLPESQLDRFLMALFLDLPTREDERSILKLGDKRDEIKELNSAIVREKLIEGVHGVSKVTVSEQIIEYGLDILELSRKGGEFKQGLSPRAGKDLLKVSQAVAFLNDREFVLPEDVQFVAPYVFGHRIGASNVQEGVNLVRKSLEKISVY